MAKDPDQPEATGRRQFFRQMFVHAVEGVEKLGRSMSERAGYPHYFDHLEDEAYHGTGWPHDVLEEQVYGPPWPPAYGPPIPQPVRARLRAQQTQTVSRGELDEPLGEGDGDLALSDRPQAGSAPVPGDDAGQASLDPSDSPSDSADVSDSAPEEKGAGSDGS